MIRQKQKWEMKGWGLSKYRKGWSWSIHTQGWLGPSPSHFYKQLLTSTKVVVTLLGNKGMEMNQVLYCLSEVYNSLVKMDNAKTRVLHIWWKHVHNAQKAGFQFWIMIWRAGSLKLLFSNPDMFCISQVHVLEDIPEADLETSLGGIEP